VAASAGAFAEPPAVDSARAGNTATQVPDFAALYEELFPFVWRTLKRLGVDPAAQDDACQEVFVVVHRRLGQFRGESSLKTWVFGIVAHVVQNQRRTQRRKDPGARTNEPLLAAEEVHAPTAGNPDEMAARSQMALVAEELLNSLDDDKRLLIILADLEELPVTEIAVLTQSNVNTAYARLKAARKAFSEVIVRYHARTAGGRK
jgi:RNA polymerase sigma-70 factor (ECF subfamily)